MIILASSLTAHRARWLPPAPWLYLGRSVAARARIARWLGEGRRVCLGSRLHRAADRFRGPYCDFFAAAGRLQPDAVNWWAGSAAWKLWAASDGFLLCCYAAVAEEWLAAADREPRTIIIEDPWLFADFSARWRSRVRVIGRPRLGLAKAVLAALGLLKRARWLLRILATYARQRRRWRGTPAAPTEPTVAIYSYPLARCLGGQEWIDPFLPGLSARIEQLGCAVRRFTPPEPTGLEAELARRQSCFAPLILFLTPRALWRALVSAWRPVWPRSLNIGGLPVRHLLAREWWMDMSHAAQCGARLFYETSRRLFARGNWRAIVFPFEHQPWERLLVLQARARGIRTIGVQHAIFSRNSLSYRLGAGEPAILPCPDAIAASGTYSAAALRQAGWPSEVVVATGSLRYAHLQSSAGAAMLPEASRAMVLVALPIDRHATRHLLAAIRNAFPDGGHGARIAFVVKPHPACTVSSGEIGFPAERAPADVRAALAQCGTVLFTGSTMGPEAVAMGRAGIRYRPELLLDVDPAEAFGDAIPSCDDRSLREALLKVVHDAGGTAAGAVARCRAVIAELFAPLDGAALDAVIMPTAAPAAVANEGV